MDIDRQCPKCGYDLRVIEDNSVTNDGIKTVTLICANCLHMEPYSFPLVKTRLPELGWRRNQQGEDFKD